MPEKNLHEKFETVKAIRAKQMKWAQILNLPLNVERRVYQQVDPVFLKSLLIEYSAFLSSVLSLRALPLTSLKSVLIRYFS